MIRKYGYTTAHQAIIVYLTFYVHLYSSDSIPTLATAHILEYWFIQI